MTRQAGPTATALTRDWQALAARAVERVTTARRGKKADVVRELAAEVGLSPFLVRRAVAARLAIEKLSASGRSVPPGLRHAPIGVCDVVTRWAEHDPPAAFAAFNRYESGELTFRGLLSAESAARPDYGRARPPRSIDLIRAWKLDCIDRLQSRLKPHQQAVQIAKGEKLPVDAWVETQGSTTSRQAVLIIGPARTSARLETDVVATILRAAGLASIGYPTILVVPYPEIARAYRYQLAELKVPDRQVTLVAIRAPHSASAQAENSNQPVGDPHS